MNKYDKYAKTKIAIKKLQIELDMIKLDIIDDLGEAGSHKTTYGTITTSTPERWKYSGDYKTSVMAAKERDIKQGKAQKVKGKTQITYRGPQNL